MAELGAMENLRESFKSLRISTVIAHYILAAVLYIDETELPTGNSLHIHTSRYTSFSNKREEAIIHWEKVPQCPTSFIKMP